MLDRDELRRLLPVLRASNRPHPAAMRFMLLTLARKEEVCGAVWAHVDLSANVWTIPQTKNGLPHQVPLSRQAAALLASLRTDAATSADPVFSVWPQGKKARAPLGNWYRETKAIHAKSKTAAWHRHALRRTGATMLGELPDIIEAALNHTAIRSSVAAPYSILCHFRLAFR